METDEVEFKAVAAEVKAVASDNPNGEFEAILSTDALDRDGESIAPGAFDPLPKSIPIFHAHDWREGQVPVGKAEPFYDGTILKARGVFASTPRAQEMRALVAEGIVDSMSVGFLKAKRSKADGKTLVTKGELFEASFTAVPVNNTAKVLAAKALAATKARARHSAAGMEQIQSTHDARSNLCASCGASKSFVKAIVGTVEALQERVRDALEDTYGEWATYLRGVNPSGTVFFDRSDGTFQQSFTDDGDVVILNDDVTEVDVHEVVVPDAAGTAADEAAVPAAEATEDGGDLAARAQGIGLVAAAYAD